MLDTELCVRFRCLARATLQMGNDSILTSFRFVSGYPLSNPPQLRGMEPVRGFFIFWETWALTDFVNQARSPDEESTTAAPCTLCEEVRIGVPRFERKEGTDESKTY